MLKRILDRNFVLACLVDFPATNHARQVALFLNGKFPICEQSRKTNREVNAVANNR